MLLPPGPAVGSGSLPVAPAVVIVPWGGPPGIPPGSWLEEAIVATSDAVRFEFERASPVRDCSFGLFDITGDESGPNGGTPFDDTPKSDDCVVLTGKGLFSPGCPGNGFPSDPADGEDGSDVPGKSPGGPPLPKVGTTVAGSPVGNPFPNIGGIVC